MISDIIILKVSGEGAGPHRTPAAAAANDQKLSRGNTRRHEKENNEIKPPRGHPWSPARPCYTSSPHKKYLFPKIFAELDLDRYITSVPPPSSALGHRRVRCCAGWQHWRFYPLKTCSLWCPLPLFGFRYEACHWLENRVCLQLTTFIIFMKGRNEWGKHNFITWLKHCCWWPVSAGVSPLIVSSWQAKVGAQLYL